MFSVGPINGLNQPLIAPVVLTEAGSELSIEVSDPNVINFVTDLISNANTNRPRLFFNDDTSETDYDNWRSHNLAAYNDSLSVATIFGSSIDTNDVVYAEISVRRMYDGSNTTFIASYTSYSPLDSGSTNGVIRKVVSGDVELEKITISSDQTNGFKLGSTLKVV